MSSSNWPNLQNIKRKKGEPKKMKTDLTDASINPKIYRAKRLSVSELVNQPSSIKKNFQYHSWLGDAKRTFKYLIND